MYLTGGHGSEIDGYSFSHNTGCNGGANNGIFSVIAQEISGGYVVRNSLELATHLGCTNQITGVFMTGLQLFYR